MVVLYVCLLRSRKQLNKFFHKVLIALGKVLGYSWLLTVSNLENDSFMPENDALK